MGTLAACLALISLAHAQRPQFGFKSGLTATDSTQLTPSESRRYVLGASGEMKLWRAFAVAADFLYRRNGYTIQIPVHTFPSAGAPAFTRFFTDRTRAHVLEVLVFGKYYFRPDEKLQPFLLAGIALRKAKVNLSFTLGNQTGEDVDPILTLSGSWTPLDIGPSIGAGLRWRFPRFSLVPEFRYTHWGSTTIRAVSQRQADILLGILF